MQIELNDDEAKGLMGLLDAAVRGVGLQASPMAVRIAAKIEQAAAAEQAKRADSEAADPVPAAKKKAA